MGRVWDGGVQGQQIMRRGKAQLICLLDANANAVSATAFAHCQAFNALSNYWLRLAHCDETVSVHGLCRK